MILDPFSHCQNRRSTKISLVSLFLTLLATSFVIGAKSVSAASLRFTETTGRAAIIDPEMVSEARLVALEDALYLAALQGGAQINGFSAVMTDTSIEDHFVIRPASRILDYTIINEVVDDVHYEVQIKAAVGALPKNNCPNERNINVTIFSPKIIHGKAAVSHAGPMAPRVINTIIEAIESHPGLNVTRATDEALDPARLSSTTDEFDYLALSSGITRVRRGDFALIPEIKIMGKRVGFGLDQRDNLVVTLKLNLFSGETYLPVESFVKQQSIDTNFKTPFRALNVLLQPKRPEILDQMRSPVDALVKEMAAKLRCQPLTSILEISDGKLSVPIGSYHGLRLNSLAVATGSDTPWHIMRVTAVKPMSAIVSPLNKKRNIADLDGKPVEFMEISK